MKKNTEDWLQKIMREPDEETQVQRIRKNFAKEALQREGINITQVRIPCIFRPQHHQVSVEKESWKHEDYLNIVFWNSNDDSLFVLFNKKTTKQLKSEIAKMEKELGWEK